MLGYKGELKVQINYYSPKLNSNPKNRLKFGCAKCDKNVEKLMAEKIKEGPANNKVLLDTIHLQNSIQNALSFPTKNLDIHDMAADIISQVIDKNRPFERGEAYMINKNYSANDPSLCVNMEQMHLQPWEYSHPEYVEKEKKEEEEAW